MRRSIEPLFCLACGVELVEPLRRTASLRCHDCRDAGAPVSFELALRARAIGRAQPTHAFEGAVHGRRPAA
jgi:hypothetical protein